MSLFDFFARKILPYFSWLVDQKSLKRKTGKYSWTDASQNITADFR
jgi:hypothetical protein